MKTSPTKDEAAADEWLLSRETERALTEEACLQFEIKLISLEHVLYNKMWDEEYILRLVNRNLCTEITKLREHVKREYSLLDRAISKVVSHKWIFESEDPGLDEIIN